MVQDGMVSIAFAAVEVRKPEAWRRFLDAVSGGAARVDWAGEDRTHALRIREGRRDDLVALGLAWRDAAAYEAALGRIARSGATLEPIAPGAARRAMRCVDPAGNTLDLLLDDDGDAADGSWPIGHVALADPDPEPLMAFYADAVGFRLNERMRSRLGPIDLRGGFLGSPQRHHSLAVLNVPGRRRLHHIMFDAPEVTAVEQMAERAREGGVPFSLTLGRHALPDGTTSFYAAAPSGFDVEIGAGMGGFDGKGAAPEGPMASLWGHAPTVRTRLKVAGALILQRAGL